MIETMNKIKIDIKEVRKPELGKQVGQGQCSEVFTWDNSRVCKLFYDSISPFNFKNEYNACVAAMSAGIPVPSVHGAVRIENRLGIIFDRIEGRDMNVDLLKRFWKLEDHMKVFVELQTKFHKVLAPDNLISQHELLEEWISRATPLPKRLREAAIKALGRLPEGNQLCHGDYHFGNVILGQDGPAIIDWQTANAGNTLGDIAATEILVLVPIVPAFLFRIVLPIQRRRVALYRQYFQKLPWFNEEEYRIWFFVVAAARIGNVQHSRNAVRHLLKLVESLWKTGSALDMGHI